MSNLEEFKINPVEGAEFDSLNSMDLGNSIPKMQPVPNYDGEDDEEEVDREKLDSEKTWLPKPSTATQYQAAPDSVKAGPLIVKVFDLGNPDQLEELNGILQGLAPEDHPESPVIDLAARRTEFFEGRFFCLLQYHQLFYENLNK